MRTIGRESLRQRIDELLSLPSEKQDHAGMSQVLQGALTLAWAVYGPDSHASKVLLLDSVKTAQTRNDGTPSYNFERDVWPVAVGVLEAMRGDVDAGLAGDLRRRGIGETLADISGVRRQFSTFVSTRLCSAFVIVST